MSATCSPSVRSLESEIAVPPASSIIFTVSSRSDCVLATVTTVAPSAAIASAASRPIPFPDPVTIAIFPSNLPMIYILQNYIYTSLAVSAKN